MDKDLEVFIHEAKQKKATTKKKSVIEKYKKEIELMVLEELELKQIFEYLKNKYDLKSNYPNFCKWVNRHIKKDTKVDIKVSTKKDDESVKPYSPGREAYSKTKPL